MAIFYCLSADRKDYCHKGKELANSNLNPGTVIQNVPRRIGGLPLLKQTQVSGVRINQFDTNTVLIPYRHHHHIFIWNCGIRKLLLVYCVKILAY
jgi:hypothetical protein